MRRKYQRWTLESVREVAKGKTPKELEASHASAYQWASRNKQLENIGLVRSTIRWNLDRVRRVAKGKVLIELKESHGGAYAWAYRNKQLDNIGLVDGRWYWNLDRVREVAEGKTSKELYLSHSGAYDWACRNGQLDNIGLIECEKSLMNKWGKELVEDMELAHKPEHKDGTCRDKDPLKFDLAIFDHYEVKVLCEFQGRQHFEPVNFGGISDEKAEAKFIAQQIKDQIKRDWCAANNIPLIEIHYSFKDEGEQAFKDELRRQLKSVGIC